MAAGVAAATEILANALDRLEPRHWLERRYGDTPIFTDLVITVAVTVSAAVLMLVVRPMHSLFTLFERLERFRIAEVFIVLVIVTCALAALGVRRMRDLRREVELRRDAERRASALANLDALTGLPNRRALGSELPRVLARATRTGQSASLLLLDLNRFKPVNDVHGHVAGDRVLVEVARRLKRVVRTEEFVARLGGDEFAIVIAHDRDEPETAAQVARRLATEIEREFEVEAGQVFIGLSIGAAIFPADAEDGETLVRRADIALYRAKQSGRSEFRFFEVEMDEEIRARAEIEGELRDAIATGAVVPNYQPLVDLRSGQVIGFETLARWSRAGRPVSPAVFIPVAEESGLIGDLAMLLLRQACRDALGWDRSLTLSFNISPFQFRDRWLAQKILGVLTETGFSAHRLEIEITESAFVEDVDAAHLTVMSLKNQGISIAIDDFGAGYSSFHHLAALPFDRIKIDGSFVRMLEKGDDHGKIVAAIVRLGQSLGLPTTGEGVETAECAARLTALGCTTGQGWYFGRPVAAAEVPALIEAINGTATAENAETAAA